MNRQVGRRELVSESKKLIKEFINDYLNGDIEQFKDFNLQDLMVDKKYGCPGRNFDSDDTEIVRAIYCVIWNGLIDDENISNINELYRGDTINTFNTSFSKELNNELTENKSNVKTIKIGKRIINNDKLINKIISFHKTYTTIGNRLLLPNKKMGSSNGSNNNFERSTLNTYRGSAVTDYNDDFNKFLVQVQKYFLGVDCDPNISALISKNSYYFNQFERNIKGFINFCDTNMLMDFIDDDSNKVKGEFEVAKYWRGYSDNDAFEKSSTNYIDKATRIINRRTERIISRLKGELDYVA